MNHAEARRKRQKATARCTVRLSAPEGRPERQVGKEDIQNIISALADALAAAYRRQTTPEERAA